MRKMYSLAELDAVVKKYIENHGAAFGGDVTISGDLSLGTEDVPADLAVSGDAVIAGDTRVEGDLVVEGGASVSEDFVANTISQVSPNFEFDMPINETYLTTNNLSIVSKYYKLIQYGNILYIVASITIQNNGESAITPSWDSIFTQYDVEIPSDMAEKIYDVAGKKVSESWSAPISYAPSYVVASGSGGGLFYFNHGGTNKVYIRASGTQSTNAGSTCSFHARTFIVL